MDALDALGVGYVMGGRLYDKTRHAASVQPACPLPRQGKSRWQRLRKEHCVWRSVEMRLYNERWRKARALALSEVSPAVTGSLDTDYLVVGDHVLVDPLCREPLPQVRLDEAMIGSRRRDPRRPADRRALWPVFRRPTLHLGGTLPGVASPDEPARSGS